MGFTLIELLVVIAIIAILAAILFPVFARAESIPFLVEICGSGLVLNLYVARKPQFLLQGLSQCR